MVGKLQHLDYEWPAFRPTVLDLVAVLLRLELGCEPLASIDAKAIALRVTFLVIGNVQHVLGESLRTLFLRTRVLLAKIWFRSQPSKNCCGIRHVIGTTHRAQRLPFRKLRANLISEFLCVIARSTHHRSFISTASLLV